MPYHTHTAFPLPAALAATAAPQLGKIVGEVLGLHLPGCALRGTLVRNLRADREDFFFALSKGAAAVTRWLPCALGKVSTPRGAGLTTPCSIAAAACRAGSSLSTGSSRRLRNWVKSSGSTKWSWARFTCTWVMPQADLTARSGRSWLQSCSSAQCRSGLRNSQAHHTRGATGARPRAVGVGQRRVQLRVTAATSAVHGKVSAHCRRGWVSGTKSATTSGCPGPVNHCWR